jgi:hypothetical protein
MERDKTCLHVKGELCAHDPLKLDDGDASINAGVDQQPSLSQHLKVRLRHVDPRVLPQIRIYVIYFSFKVHLPVYFKQTSLLYN